MTTKPHRSNPERSRNTRRQRGLVIALVLNVVVVVGQVGWGLAAHSLGLLADAGHNFADVAALGIAVFALRYAVRAPTTARSFGHHRATILAALANGGLLLAVTLVIAVEAVVRLTNPRPVHGGIVAIVALGAAVLELPLEFDDDVWRQVLERYARFGRIPAESNRSQAMVPRGAVVDADSTPEGTPEPG